jgi:tetratricopeptide (TPR) repeat protein
VTVPSIIALFTAILTMTAVPELDAATVRELIAQGDRVLQAEDQFPQSFEQAIALYRQAAGIEPDNALPYLRVATACLALGDGVKENRLSWYEEGGRAAENALMVAENNPDAHFLFAANKGNVVNLRPFWKVSPGVVAELETHLLRALALSPQHSRANHMMGMLLYRTPGPLRLLLVGTRDQAESYLVRAVEADPNFAEARFDLAHFYTETGRPDQARRHAQAILTMSNPTPRRVWVEKYRPAAEQLLRKLPLQ